MVIFVRSVSRFCAQTVKNGWGEGTVATPSYFAQRKRSKHTDQLTQQIRTAGTVANVDDAKYFKDNNVVYRIKNVEIMTCGKLYRQWRKKSSLYDRAPDDGLKFNVEYVDTKEDDSVPTVLALHGAPGTHGDFQYLINDIMRIGGRVVAPNFPDWTAIDRSENVYQFSDEEKTQFLVDFLKAINLKQIDTVVTHSSAVYPGLRVWQEPDGPEVKSFAILNPSGHRRIKAMKPKWFTDHIVRMYVSPTGRNMYRKVGRYVLKAMGVAVNSDNVDNALLAATTMRKARVHQLVDDLTLIKNGSVPLLYVYSDNDKLVDREIFGEMADILGANENNFNRYGKDGQLTKSRSQDEWLKIMAFQSGGHYAFLRYAPLVNQEIVNLLKSVTNVKTELINAAGPQNLRKVVDEVDTVDTDMSLVIPKN